MTEPKKADIYRDGTYLETFPTWHGEDSVWKAQQIKKILEKNALTPATICEVGCGAGEILKQLSAQLDSGIKFTGLRGIYN
jgi:hypothetical protein